jgi:hypothetical protein
MIYTARYSYCGPDRVDITVKGKDPLFSGLAPTWDMVRGFKNGTLTPAAYTGMYFDLINQRLKSGNKSLTNLHKSYLENGSVTLVCFCPADSFCHRYLLAHKLCQDWAIPYGGER